MLADNQDPGSLDARIAHHLHRLDIKGTSLARKIQRSNDVAAQLTSARLSLTEQHVAELAAAIHVDYEDLTRPLHDDEHIEWHFYRVSARNPRHVWDAARGSWLVRGHTITSAANMMQLSRSHVSHCSAPHNEKPTPLTYHPAFLLSTALSLPLGTDHFLPKADRFHTPDKSTTTR